VQGMGGIGKTVLATALARDEEVRRAFPDGVIWITFGQTPQILTLQSDVVEALGDKQASFTEINSGKTQLRKLLTGKACLLILDDVWNLEHASAFDVLEERCQMVITTRDAGIITALGGEEYQLSILSEKQALALLADWAEKAVETLPKTAQDVARECGYLPLALSLNGAMVRDGTSWGDLLEALSEADLEFFEHPHGSILKSIKISIDALLPNEAQHYLELAVFPEDTAVPEATIVQLWTCSNQLKDRNARKLLTTLARKALLRTTGEAPQRKVELHDLQYLYLRRAVSSLSELHTQFLDAYTQKYPNGWHSLENDAYIFQNLAHHLIEAGRATELQQLLLDFRWLQAKLENSNINELIADYNLLPENANLQLLQRTLLLSGHILAEDKRQLAGQLWGRLQCFQASEIQQLLQQAKQNQTTWLRPVTASLTTPDGNLIRTLIGHTDSVKAIAFSVDGKYLVSGSQDSTLKVWDWQTGVEVRTIQGHTNSVDAIAFSVDGKYLVSGSADKTLKVWDWQAGVEVRTLTGHTSSVLAIAFSVDGKYLVSGSWDKTLKVWDWQTGVEVRTLSGHTYRVYAIAFSVDGKYLVSGSDDNTLKVWDWQTGEVIATFTGDSTIHCCAVAPDGVSIVAGEQLGGVHFLQLEGV
ncbi:MAG: NB-ARC domain-containing protein, partial [Hassallia sp.]